MELTEGSNERRMASTSSDSVELPVLISDLIDINTFVSRRQCQIVAVRCEADSLNNVRAIIVNRYQLSGGGVQDHPLASDGRADYEQITVGRECRSVNALGNVFAPHHQVRHCVPEMDHFVVTTGDELILCRVNCQRRNLLNVTLLDEIKERKVNQADHDCNYL